MTDKVAKLDSKSVPQGAADRTDVAKLAYVERRAVPGREKPGSVGFDDLGNAQFQWDQSLLSDDVEGEAQRQRALSIANLVLVDDEPPPDRLTIQENKKGLRVGYNPYDSGRLQKQQWRKPRDLRALSKWIESQKKLSQPSGPDEEE